MFRFRCFTSLLRLVCLTAVLMTCCESLVTAQKPDAAAQQAAAAQKKQQEQERAAAENIQITLLRDGWLGPGDYFSAIKLPLYILLFLAWVGCASWANCDQERLKKEGQQQFNLFYTALYAGGGTLVFFIPLFWVAFVLSALLCFVPILLYVSARNKGLPDADQVLTAEHLYYLFAVGVGKIGIKLAIQKRTAYSGGPAIELDAVGADAQMRQARLVSARNLPGYNLFRENLYEAIKSRATAIMFDFTPQQTLIRHQVDGVWLELVPIPRTPAGNQGKDVYEQMLESAKTLIGGKPADRRSKQTGAFTALYGVKGKKRKPTKYEFDFVSQGTKTGEAVMIQMHTQSVQFQNLEQLGMRAEMQPLVMNQLNCPKGVFLLAAPPGHGLRSTVSVFERVCDRFTRDVVNVEDAAAASEAVENIILAQYDSSKGESPLNVLPDVLFKGFSVYFIRDISNPDVLQLCCGEVEEGRQFMMMFRAKDGVEALCRLVSGKVPAKTIAPVLNAVLTQRLIRLLCPSCKESYHPDAKLLQQLGLRPDQVQQLYQKRTRLPDYEERKRGVCPECNGVGYKGRTALFELLRVSDETKALLLSNPDPAAIRKQMNKEGQRNFLFEGIHLLIKGETSVDELSKA
ncbi:MAG: Flp pilus assembly complex ATPase component TadA, partial [Planctomycetaceae bacterium]|nr:Flp pilus assembly complex ATPase component TadA [Planctomycetaceae bacterium]